MDELAKWVEEKVKEEKRLEYIVDLMTEYYGVDAGYYGVDAYSFAKHLIEKGIAFPVRCKDCKHYNVFRLECHNGHMNGYIGIEGFCSYGERKDK